MKWLRSSLILNAWLALFFASFAFAQSPPLGFDAKKLKGVDTSTRRQLTDEEIQQQIFKGQKKEGPVDVFMPVFYEHMTRALTRLKTRVTQHPGAPSTLEIDPRSMIDVLEELVVKKWMEKIRPLRKSCDEKAESCLIPLTSFNDPDVKIVFDEAALEVRIHVPPELRAPRSSSMFRYSLAELDAPTNDRSFVSSFVNINASDVIRSEGSGYKDGRDPLNVHLDSGTRLGRIVIDASGRYTEKRDNSDQTPAFMREDVRAVTDFERSKLRLQAGDLNYPVKGFQLYRPMGGVALFTQFSLDPSHLTLPGGNYEVYLARPSKVMVFINEQMIQLLDLPAGRHNLRDFPFNSGLNDLRLEITDDMGRTEVQHYTYFSAADLLKPGLNEVTYAIGQPSHDNLDERTYDSHATTISASHRRGFTQWMTLGMNFQHDPLQTIAGLESLFSTKIGYFSFEPAYSVNAGQPGGYAGRLRYVMQEYIGKEKSNRFTALEVTSKSPYFAQLGIREPRNYEAAKIQATHTRAISKRANLTLSSSLQFNRDLGTGANLGNSFSLNLGVAHRWANGLSTNFSFRHTSTAGASDEIAVMGFLVWAFTEERQFVTSSYDSGSDSARADWTYQPSLGVGGFTTQANVQKKASSKSYGGVVDYVGNRARLSASHDVELPVADDTQPAGTPRKSINTTNLRAGTAIVFAGGHFALSRPVTDSFAVLYPLANLRGQNVKVNPQMDESYLAQTDWLGPAVTPELSSYSLTSIQLGQKNLKTGTALPHDHFLIRPAYRSGYAIAIGSDATVYLTTTLLVEEGKPGSMLAGQAFYLDDTSKEPVTVFTNRAGLLRSEGFRPGRYRLEVPDYQPIEFTIPESAGETYAMPPIQLKAGKS